MNNFDLHKHPKINSGFKTPEHYFDDFSAKIVQQLPEADTTKVIPLFGSKLKWMSAIAAVLLIAISIPLLNQSSAKANDIDTATLENYLSDQSNVSQYDVINLLNTEDIKDIKIDLALDDKAMEDVLSQNNNLELYLNE